MKQWNRVTLAGYLGTDPVIKTSKNGRNFLQLSLATHRSWMNKEDNTWEKRTDWHRLISWNRKIMDQSPQWRKGDAIMVDGELVSFDTETDGKNQRNVAVECRDVKVLKKWSSPVIENEKSPT
jgi:single-strand DNA-binding protein